MSDRRIATLATHVAKTPPSRVEPLAPPITPSSVYGFPDLEHLIAVGSGRAQDWYYRRYGHPNSKLLEETIRRLEGGEAALATSSGMSAFVCLSWASLRSGDHIIAAQDLYGGTTAFMTREFPRLGIQVSAVPTDLDSVRAALRPNTRALLFEVLSNPLLKVADTAALIAFAKKNRLVTVIDNTFATPVLRRPLEDGADIVYHSATKFLGGHGDAVGGVIAGRQDWVEAARKLAISIGATISPFDAWLILRGIKTLHVRVERASVNAQKIACTLKLQPRVKTVHYPGFGPMLSFELKGNMKTFCRSLKLVAIAPSLGDVTTTMTHPYSTSHAYLPESERLRLGVTPALIRLSVGIDDPDDVLEDISQALRRTK